MIPIKFPGHNIVYAKDQPQYLPLPALKIDSPRGEVISCWKMTFRERLKVLFTGKIWLSMWSFNKPLTPCLLTTDVEDLIENWKTIRGS